MGEKIGDDGCGRMLELEKWGSYWNCWCWEWALLDGRRCAGTDGGEVVVEGIGDVLGVSVGSVVVVDGGWYEGWGFLFGEVLPKKFGEEVWF